MGLPPDVHSLTTWEPARRYLRGRGFDPDEIGHVWGVKAVGPHGGPWRHRLLIPVWGSDYQVLTWQARAIGSMRPKYLAAPPRWEVRAIKRCVYGLAEAVTEGKRTAFVVEGVTDAWRLGVGAVAVFGMTATRAQVRLLVDHFRKAFVWLDPGAWHESQALARQLTFAGLKAEALRFSTDRDPGGLDTREARNLKRNLELGELEAVP